MEYFIFLWEITSLQGDSKYILQLNNFILWGAYSLQLYNGASVYDKNDWT